jgi:hypothetical protein
MSFKYLPKYYLFRNLAPQLKAINRALKKQTEFSNEMNKSDFHPDSFWHSILIREDGFDPIQKGMQEIYQTYVCIDISSLLESSSPVEFLLMMRELNWKFSREADNLKAIDFLSQIDPLLSQIDMKLSQIGNWYQQYCQLLNQRGLTSDYLYLHLLPELILTLDLGQEINNEMHVLKQKGLYQKREWLQEWKLLTAEFSSKTIPTTLSLIKAFESSQSRFGLSEVILAFLKEFLIEAQRIEENLIDQPFLAMGIQTCTSIATLERITNKRKGFLDPEVVLIHDLMQSQEIRSSLIYRFLSQVAFYNYPDVDERPARLNQLFRDLQFVLSCFSDFKSNELTYHQIASKPSTQIKDIFRHHGNSF